MRGRLHTPRRRKIALLLTMLLGVVLGFGALTPAAYAEETPLTVPLSYIVNLSNWGPTTATGTAQVWRGAAEVNLHVQGLPLLHNQLYACWLVNPTAGTFLAVGRFNVAADGTATLDVSLPGSLPSGYTTVLVTVQPDPEATHSAPSKLYSIAGLFPGNAAIQHQVQHLPDTGANAAHPPFETVTPPPETTAATPATPPNPWLPYVPLGVTLLSLGFVLRRNKLRRR